MMRTVYRRWAVVFAVASIALLPLIIASMFWCIGFQSSQTVVFGVAVITFETVPLEKLGIESIETHRTLAERIKLLAKAPSVSSRSYGPTTFSVSLAWPVMFLAGLSLFCSWRARHVRVPDHCTCGYNHTGNVSGICPECGMPIRRDA